MQTFDKIPDNEGGTCSVYEVVKIQLPPRSNYEIKYEYQDPTGKNSTIANQAAWSIDSMLIDEEMLYLEDEEADRMYQELK